MIQPSEITGSGTLWGYPYDWRLVWYFPLGRILALYTGGQYETGYHRWELANGYRLPGSPWIPATRQSLENALLWDEDREPKRKI